MSHEEPIVRSAKMEDLDSIFSIEGSSFSDPYPKGLLKAFFHMPGEYLVAVSEGKIVGYAIGIIRYGDVGHVVSIAVLKEYRRRGVGERLLGRLIEGLGGHGAEEMRLEVRESNSQAICLYRKMGFRDEGIIKNYYADGESALVMGFTWSRCPRR